MTFHNCHCVSPRDSFKAIVLLFKVLQTKVLLVIGITVTLVFVEATISSTVCSVRAWSVTRRTGTAPPQEETSWSLTCVILPSLRSYRDFDLSTYNISSCCITSPRWETAQAEKRSIFSRTKEVNDIAEPAQNMSHALGNQRHSNM